MYDEPDYIGLAIFLVFGLIIVLTVVIFVVGISREARQKLGARKRKINSRPGFPVDMEKKGITELLETMEKDVYTAFPSAMTFVDIMPLTATLTVKLGGRLFVIEHDPDLGFGVDEVLEGEGFTKFNHRFARVREAREFLMSILPRS